MLRFALLQAETPFDSIWRATQYALAQPRGTLPGGTDLIFVSAPPVSDHPYPVAGRHRDQSTVAVGGAVRPREEKGLSVEYSMGRHSLLLAQRAVVFPMTLQFLKLNL